MDVAAILSTSATVNGVVEAFGVRESPSMSIVREFTPGAGRSAFEQLLDGARGAASASLAPAGAAASASASAPGAVPAESPWVGTPDPVIGPSGAVGPSASPELIVGLRGASLLGQLALLPRAELADLLARNPELVTATLAAPPLARDVTAWWTATPDEGRARLAAEAPELVGGLDGIPYRARDAANRARLAADSAELRARLEDGAGRAEARDLETRLHMLDEISAALETGESGLPRTLVQFDTTGEGRAVIAIGDLDRADYVSYLVPGMFFSIDAQLVSWTGLADALAAKQNAWLERLGPSVAGSTATGPAGSAATAPAGMAPAGTAATVSWIGYETPTLLNVASMDLAREGRDTLTSALQGLDALREDGPHVSVFAHSYGSTAAMLALEENAVEVDALAVMGSPGSPAPRASDLKVRDGDVWVGVAWWDPIPSSGVFGSQPASAAYGARHFGVDGATDPITGEALSGALSHNDYFTPGSESFRNLALIGIDRDELVLPPDADAPARGLAGGFSARR